MDEHEKIVLRRKRPLVVQILPFSVPMQKKLRDEKMSLLEDSMMAEIMPEQSAQGQMHRFLEQLMRKNPGNNAFERLQTLLREEGFGWVADEMQIDLLAEKNELLIEPYIEKEAAMIVHKKFGHKKTISEETKGDFAYILALKHQAAKEAIIAQVERITDERDEALAFKMDEESKVKMLADKIKTFLKIHKAKINEHVGQESAADNARGGEGSLKNSLVSLEENIDGVLGLMARMNLEKEKLNDERTKSFKILGIQKGAVSLDLGIRHALLNAAEDIKKSQRQADVTEEMASQLDSRLRNTQLVSDRETEAKDKQLIYLEKQLRANKDKCQDIEGELARYRKLLAERQHELDKANRDMLVLKKTRLLGYVNPNWVDQISAEQTADGEQALLPVESEDEKPNGKMKSSRSNATIKDSSKGSGGSINGKRQPLNKRGSDLDKASSRNSRKY